MRLALVLALSATPVLADPDHAAIAERALSQHILPGFERLAATTAALSGAADAACAAGGPIDRAPLDDAYQQAFDAWEAVSHLSFGPMEEDNAGFAIAFLPDTRGAIPKALNGLISAEDPVVDDPAAFADVSVAARGLFALDQLVFDPTSPPIEGGSYRCRLLTAITTNLAATTESVLARWRDQWGPILTSAGDPDNPVYLAPEESTRELYSALDAGLQATIDLRLGRPLGTWDKPQPRRAEAWRSDRSLRGVVVALEGTRGLAETAFLPELAPDAAAAVLDAFDSALAAAERIGEPLPDAVATTQGHVRVESLQTAVRSLQERVAEEIGAGVGATTGFNAMDGD
jgi:uncharacterized protein